MHSVMSHWAHTITQCGGLSILDCQCVLNISAKEHEQKQADSHVDSQEVGLIIDDSVLGVAQVTDFAGGAILGQQDIASVQILVHQQPLVHLGQAGCHLLQHHHHLLSPKPAVQVKSVSDTSGLAFAGSASSTVACLNTVNTIQPGALQSQHKLSDQGADRVQKHPCIASLHYT